MSYFISFYKLIVQSAKDFANDNAMKFSASLSYYTAFSIAPILIIIIGVAGIFFGKEAIQGEIYRQFSGLIGSSAADMLQTSISNMQLTGVNTLQHYLNLTEGTMSLFDVPLHMKFHQASKSGKDFDLRGIFDNTLTQVNPFHAVPFVDNHDSQPLQSLESPVEPWFKPIAYALILLREQGVPCVFHPDVYGAIYTDKGSDGHDHEIHLPPVTGIQAMLTARKNHAYGAQNDYFDDPNLVGWTRAGAEDHTGSGCAVLVSNGEGGSKQMRVGERHANTVFVNLLSGQRETVQLDHEGNGTFHVAPGTVSVWVPQA